MNKILNLLIATILSFAGIYFAFSGENYQTLYNELLRVQYLGILFATLLLIFSCYIRALRWKILIDPLEKVSLKIIFSSTMIGYFGNGVLAFRLGEILKAYSISKNSEMDSSQAFGTVIIERFLDLIMVMVLFLMVIPWFPFNNEAIKFGMITFMIITLLISFSIYIVIKFNVNFMNYLENTVKSKILNFLFKAIKNIIVSMRTIRNSKNKIKLVVYSFILWFFYVLITKIILTSCGLNLSYSDTIILFIIGSLSLGIPALPGSAGTYDASVKYGLTVIFLVNSNKALTYALLSHAVSYFPLVLIGAVYFFSSTFSLKDIKSLKI